VAEIARGFDPGDDGVKTASSGVAPSLMQPGRSGAVARSRRSPPQEEVRPRSDIRVWSLLLPHRVNKGDELIYRF
jgi:hypothetical protein